MHIITVKTGKRPSRTQSKKTSQVNKAFSHDITAAILVYQDNPVGDEHFLIQTISFGSKHLHSLHSYWSRE